NKGRIETEIKGPPDKFFPHPEGTHYATLPMVLTVAPDHGQVDIEVADQKITLKPGEWSDWVRFPFSFNPLIKLNGMGRFRVLSLEPEVRLYLSPIQFDPTALPPLIDITAPRKFVHQLTDQFGRFKTIGWAVDTWSLKGGTIDEKVFLEDVDFTRGKEEQMLYGTLERAADWDVLVQYFEYTDRVQHMMWRLFDPQHPMYDPALAAKYGNSILESYQAMDNIVGETMKRIPAGTHLMVVSDHGFKPFRWSMNYNTWLVKNGYMVLNGQTADPQSLENLFEQGDFFVNLEGREAKGIVKPGAEYDALLQELKAKLEGFVDEKTGLRPVAHVFTRDEAHKVYDPALIPDLIPSNSAGYRVGWQDTLGGVAKEIVEDNNDYWSADHCSVYPPLVDGILFSTKKLVTAPRQPYIADVFPTVVASYGIAVPTDLDGKDLLTQ